MWFLPSLGRPDKIRKWVVDAYEWGHVEVRLLLYKGDPRLGEYEKQKWPRGWKIEVVDCLYNTPTLQEAFRRYPNERSYGVWCDDCTPETKGMMEILEDCAQGYTIAYANDGHFKEVLAQQPAIGGELMRAMGGFPSGFTHGGLDSAWHDIGHELRTLRYYPNLKFTHWFPSKADVEFDTTHMHSMNASKTAWLEFKNWREGGPKKELLDKLRPMMAAYGQEPQGQPIVFVGA